MKSQEARVVKLAVLVVFCTLALGFLVFQRTTYAVSLPQSAQTKNPLQPTEKNIALGLDHFDAHCASCHGSTGRADIEKGKAVKAADLTSDKVQSKSDAELFRTISRGVSGTAMPAFGKTHTPTEIWQAILFVRKLPTLTPEGRKKLESAVPANARHKHGAGKGEEHHHPEADAPTQPEPDAHDMSNMGDEKAGTGDAHIGHDMSKMGEEKAGTGDAHSGHDMSDHDMSMMGTITGGPFRSMSAVGSGTSLMPASAPGYMWHWMKDDWMIMVHGNLIAGFNHQGGPRGVNKAESQNWFMLQHSVVGAR